MRRRGNVAAIAAAGAAGLVFFVYATAAVASGTTALAPARSLPAAVAVAVRAESPGTAASLLAAAVTGRPAVQALRLALPADGSLVEIDAAGAVATLGPDAVGGAVALTGVRLLDGEVAAAAVSVHVTHGAAGEATPGGAPLRIDRLTVLGMPVAAATGVRIAVGDWAELAVGVRTTGPKGAAGLAALRLRLLAPHRGVATGTVVTVGWVAAAGRPAPARTARPARATAAQAAPRAVAIAATATRLTPGGHVFPLARRTPVTDTYGAVRAEVAWHHGIDLFAPRGTPVLAVAPGTLHHVGWNALGGYRLWLRDRAGNNFYFAHLDAYAPGIRDGAQVHAGQPLGTLGSSGDAEHTPPHLHFEAHPAAFAAIGYDGAVDPTALLAAWAADRDLPFGAAPTAPSTARVTAARPAAFLVEAEVGAP